ncbi:MAG: 4Fe-4S binding protein, partial [Desulfobacterales bacterium]
IVSLAAALWIAGVRWVMPGFSVAGSLQTGLLDPLPLVYRSLNLVLLPLGERFVAEHDLAPRFYSTVGFMGLWFALILLVGLVIPRAYCRFVCPLGALFGTLGRFYLLRIGKKRPGCKACNLCESQCQGACAPSAEIRSAECVLCFNCWDSCRHGRMGYGSRPSASGEKPRPDVTRRSALISLAAGVGLISLERLQGRLAGNWHPGRIRPPGALREKDFLQRCIKCGQCMRVCPTNVIHPADLRFGWEAYWTPVLNFRLGLSGCQPNCVACSQICPTAALRPLSLAERMGGGEFRRAGAVCIGTAFVDRGRCLPWAMDRPCIVCQEVCPVSPKAIFTRALNQPLPGAERLAVSGRNGPEVRLADFPLLPGALGGGDFGCRLMGEVEDRTWKILDNGAGSLTLMPGADGRLPEPGQTLQLEIHLQQPFVDPARCIGCGICQHECPVRGLPAIRVTAEGETRDPAHRMLA